MPLQTIFAYKYLVFAFIGAGIKTYADYKRGTCSLLSVLSSFIANLVIAGTIAYMVADVVIQAYPDKTHLLWFFSFLSGLVGINITLAITRIKWQSLIENKLKSFGGGSND